MPAWLSGREGTGHLGVLCDLALLGGLTRLVVLEDVGRVVLVLAAVRLLLAACLSGLDHSVRSFALSDGRAPLREALLMRVCACPLPMAILSLLCMAAYAEQDGVLAMAWFDALILFPGLTMLGPCLSYLRTMHVYTTHALLNLVACALPVMLGLACAIGGRANAVIYGYLAGGTLANLLALGAAWRIPDVAERPESWQRMAFTQNARRLSVVRGALGARQLGDCLLVGLVSGVEALAFYGAARAVGDAFLLLGRPLHRMVSLASDPGDTGRRIRRSLLVVTLIVALFAGLGWIAAHVLLDCLAPGFLEALTATRLLIVAGCLRLINEVFAVYAYRQGRQQVLFVTVVFVLPLPSILGAWWVLQSAGFVGVAAVMAGTAGLEAALIGAGTLRAAVERETKPVPAPDCAGALPPEHPALPVTQSADRPRL